MASSATWLSGVPLLSQVARRAIDGKLGAWRRQGAGLVEWASAADDLDRTGCSDGKSDA
ncbi:MAG: hypothetical protein QF786_03260 [Vicinamibacterales bacterium]|nr:hypothetical protein [Vicinamibacterales bacterium]MDP7691819.1 hypothetical protein [Vicinamibacterales bacterium]HJN45103.1 hypothetical protein [Vicinamibacterales bacterium]